MQKCLYGKQIFVGGLLKKGPPKEKFKVALTKHWTNYKNQHVLTINFWTPEEE